METEKNLGHVYNLDIEAVFAAFDTSVLGLDESAVAKRLDQYGTNTVPPPKTSLLKRLIEPFTSVFVGVLLIAAVLSVIEHHIVDAVIIAIIVGVNALIYYFQQYSVGRVLKTLHAHDVSTVHVLRSGRTVPIMSEDLTYGDVVHIEEGMKVPADGRLVSANQIEADEALLTGESLPVHKHAAAILGEKQLYDQKNMLFKGTYVKSGIGLMVVTGIGLDTEIGGITTLTGSANTKSPIEHKIDSLVRKLILVIGIAALTALALAVYRGIALEEALRFSLVIVVSAVPEGLPVALTIVLLLCARRMAQVNALVKKISSIETMGAITMIATDKTGTITQNKLSVAAKHTSHGSVHTFDEAIRASLDGGNGHVSDPLDAILLQSIQHVSVPPSWSKVKELPFNQKLRISGTLWKHGSGYSLFIKGAPEHVLAYCGTHHRNDNKARQTLEEFTTKGYRTIAFAHQDYTTLPQHIGKNLNDMSFDGFVGLSDSLRPGIAEAVNEAHRAGIKVVMLTGDHVATAGFVAQQSGIATGDNDVQDSTALEGGSVDAIRQSLQTTRVYGRVLPEHKFALLKATKGYEITAMTGDGVNDVPALVEADAGIAMGSGTDAAKDASDIVLLDDNFHTIVNAVRIGRTALANIRKMVMYLLGTSGGEVLTMLLALAFNIPLPVAAIQILWINLVTDGVVVIPLGLSPSEPKHMLASPRSPQAPLLNAVQASRVALMAVTMSVSVLAVYKINLRHGHEYAQTLAFLSLIVVQWVNAFNVNFEYRSWLRNFVSPNAKLWLTVGASVIAQVAVFMTPIGKWLDVTAVNWRDAVVAVVVPAAAVLIVVDVHKLIFRRHID